MSFRSAFGSTFFGSDVGKFKNGKISLERIVEKMAHNPAIFSELKKRFHQRRLQSRFGFG
jgi:dihydroorotase-like cyclic amidohydrolase